MTDATLLPRVIEALEEIADCTWEDLESAPLIEDWIIAGADALHLVGRVVGHPTIRDGRVRTSLLIAISVNAGHARTLNRFYRLGAQLGEPRVQ